ncbi:hypothetical protein BaRGS_00018350, partial [Batillaria attramentaria]
MMAVVSLPMASQQSFSRFRISLFRSFVHHCHDKPASSGRSVDRFPTPQYPQVLESLVPGGCPKISPLLLTKLPWKNTPRDLLFSVLTLRHQTSDEMTLRKYSNSKHPTLKNPDYFFLKETRRNMASAFGHTFSLSNTGQTFAGQTFAKTIGVLMESAPLIPYNTRSVAGSPEGGRVKSLGESILSSPPFSGGQRLMDSAASVKSTSLPLTSNASPSAREATHCEKLLIGGEQAGKEDGEQTTTRSA